MADRWGRLGGRAWGPRSGGDGRGRPGKAPGWLPLRPHGLRWASSAVDEVDVQRDIVLNADALTFTPVNIERNVTVRGSSQGAWTVLDFGLHVRERDLGLDPSG